MSRSSRASSSPSPTWRISSARSDSVPRAAKKSGLACATIRAPSASFGAPASSTSRCAVTVRLMSAAGSRRVRKTVWCPGGRVTWATCPSTQTQPSLATQAPIFWLTTRTGHGSSAVDGVSDLSAGSRDFGGRHAGERPPD